ncbi:MAG: cbb3-type cytochrome oxidase assembly protein CcoS [Capnocytophaga sp.]|nr:cbb3-type cytochrome oxidase assembly protein CcoS [Capnocytophaga sp.]
MSVIYMLISISTLVAGLFFFLCIKAIKSGQYEDTHSPSVRMLFEDELVQSSQENKGNNQENLNKNKT